MHWRVGTDVWRETITDIILNFHGYGTYKTHINNMLHTYMNMLVENTVYGELSSSYIFRSDHIYGFESLLCEDSTCSEFKISHQNRRPFR